MINIFFADENEVSFHSLEEKKSFYPWSGKSFVAEEALPEINCGFMPDQLANTPYIFDIMQDSYGVYAKYEGDGEVPLSYSVKVSAGNYIVKAELYSESDVDDVLVYLGRRCLAWKGSLKAGKKCSISGIENVCPIIPRYHDAAIEDETLNITVIGNGVHLCGISFEKTEVNTIYIAGDSTVTDQSGVYPYYPELNYSGWGQMLSAFSGMHHAVSNHAHSGLTTKSFREEGHHAIVLDHLKAGDYFLIQFGHNDQKLDELKAEEGYKENLIRYIEEVREKSAIPVIVTPLGRNTWKGDEYNDLLEEYAKVCHDVARELDVKLIDLHKESINVIKSVGRDDAKKWFYPSDYTHTNDFGAFKFAAFIYKELFNENAECTWDAPNAFRVVKLPDVYLRTDDIIDNSSILSVDRPDDRLKRYEALELVISALKYFPVNVYNDIFKDIVGHELYAGAVQCAYQNGIMPDYILEKEELCPEEYICGKEFLDYIECGLLGRSSEKYVVDDENKPIVSDTYQITRGQACKLLNSIKI